jgi:predicted nucleic acid-binding protein
VIVVADTSVFLNLCSVRREMLLPALFDQVFAPPVVRDEFLVAARRLPRFEGLSFPEWVQLRSPQRLERVPSPLGLDAGVRAALALALELPADLVLVDEARGRAVARQLGLRVLGILGVLLRAKAAGHLPAIAPVLDELKSRTQFWLSSAAREQILRLAGEQT